MYSGCERLFFFMATTTLIFPEVARAGVLIYSILSLSLSLSLTTSNCGKIQMRPQLPKTCVRASLHFYR